MLRLLDAGTGAYATVRPARPGLLRVCAHAPPGAAARDITGLRLLLVTDLLARAAELLGLQVLTALVSPGPPAEQPALPEVAPSALGIHPPAVRASAADADAALGGPADVRVVTSGSSVGDGLPGLVTAVGTACIRCARNDDAATPGGMLGGHDQDPLAVRCALMCVPYGHRADLTENLLTSARETVRAWRRQVAVWAESPSGAIPEGCAQTLRAAAGGLDTPAVLALLRSLASDAGVPAGAKFETFAYADRILGLDLARDVGRPQL